MTLNFSAKPDELGNDLVDLEIIYTTNVGN